MTADFTWPAHRGVLEPVAESRWRVGWCRLRRQVDVAAMLAVTALIVVVCVGGGTTVGRGIGWLVAR
jgi:hypothetical protein